MDYQHLARRWLDGMGLPGKVISQRQYPDRFAVVLDSGQNIYIPLVALDALNIPEPAPAPAKPKRKRRSRRKANG